MASIRVLQGVAGDDFSWIPGDVVDLSDEEAAKWADGYRAEYVTPPAKKPEPKAAQAEKPEPREEAAEDAAPAAAEKAAVRSRGGGRGSRTTTRGK